MNLFGMLEVSGSAMTAERQRAQVVVSNMANAQTTRTPEGGPYKRQLVVFRAQRHPEFPMTMMLALAGGRSSAAEGVRVEQVVNDTKPPVLRYEPGNPDADAKGYVAYLALHAIEQMLGCKTEACLTTSAALDAWLDKMDQETKRTDKVFDGKRGAEEMARITSSYASKLHADQVRTVVCGEFIWVRIEGSQDSANLLFLRKQAEVNGSSQKEILGKAAG